MKKLILIGFISIGNFSNTMAASPVTGSVYINERRNTATLAFKNNLVKEVFCEQLQINYKIVGDEFGEPIGEFSEMLKSVYLQPRQEVLKENLAQDLKKFSTKTRTAIIGDASTDFSACRVVSFVDYCNEAIKSNDERYTLNAIMTASKTGRCEDVESSLKGKLILKQAHISNLKPISYLTQLKLLDLSENNITSDQDLATLVQLVNINLSNNPLSTIDNVIILPNVEIIDISNSDLTYKIFEHRSPRLKKLIVRNTPYEAVAKERKKIPR